MFLIVLTYLATRIAAAKFEAAPDDHETAAPVSERASLAVTPQPPYTAVIFSSIRTEGDNGYAEMSDRMDELAARQPGYLGIESAHSDLGITVSYWATEDDARNWKQVADHRLAQQLGRQDWYERYRVRVATVEREYGFSRDG